MVETLVLLLRQLARLVMSLFELSSKKTVADSCVCMPCGMEFTNGAISTFSIFRFCEELLFDVQLKSVKIIRKDNVNLKSVWIVELGINIISRILRFHCYIFSVFFSVFFTGAAVVFIKIGAGPVSEFDACSDIRCFCISGA